jgi:hypothetical protein
MKDSGEFLRRIFTRANFTRAKIEKKQFVLENSPELYSLVLKFCYLITFCYYF